MVKKKRLIIFASILSMLVLLACGLLDTARDVLDVAGEIRDLQENVEIGEVVDQPRGSQDNNKPREVSGKDIEDFPLYPGSVRTWYMHLTQDNRNSTQVVYAVPADVEEIFEFYEEELEKHGWKIEATVHMEETRFVEAKDDEGQRINLIIAEDGQYEGYNTMSVGVDF